MRLIIVGCDYTGKTTLAQNVRGWLTEHLGEPRAMVHDHFMPRIGEGRPGVTPEEEEAEFYKLAPFALEMYTRYMTHYHLGDHFYSDNDHIVVNWYYGDAVYAPMYFGFGGPGEYADRRVLARGHDAEVKHIAPDTVIVHMTASPEVVRERMQAEPRPTSRFREDDIQFVLDRFAEEFSHTLIRRRIVLDTSESTPESTFKEFLSKMEPHLTPVDRQRLLAHQVLQQQLAG
jgi:thymidylate kinase